MQRRRAFVIYRLWWMIRFINCLRFAIGVFCFSMIGDYNVGILVTNFIFFLKRYIYSQFSNSYIYNCPTSTAIFYNFYIFSTFLLFCINISCLGAIYFKLLIPYLLLTRVLSLVLYKFLFSALSCSITVCKLAIYFTSSAFRWQTLSIVSSLSMPSSRSVSSRSE